jgi:hypothetical protein
MQLRYLLLPVLAVLCLGAAKKKDAVTVRFHLQASEQDGAPFVMKLPGGGATGPAYIKKVPEISEHDIAEVYPFPADDGTLGCAFRLTEHGKIVLDSMSVEQRGKALVSIVNLRVVSAVMIDRRVSDGVIMISRGLTEEEVRKITKKYKVIGEAKKRR